MKLRVAAEQLATTEEKLRVAAQQLATMEEEKSQLSQLLKKVVTGKFSVDSSEYAREVITACMLEPSGDEFRSELEKKVGTECIRLCEPAIVDNLVAFRQKIIAWLPNCHGKSLQSDDPVLSNNCLNYIKDWVKLEADRLEPDRNTGKYDYDSAFSALWRLTFDQKNKAGDLLTGK